MKLLALLVSPFLLGTSFADVWVVDPRDPHLPNQIQDAVDAAKDGDSILVRSGTYAGVTLQEKALSVVAELGAQVKIDGTVLVRDLPAGRSVFLAGLEIRGFLGTSVQEGLHLRDNQGSVHVTSCHVSGRSKVDEAAAVLERSAEVVLRDCGFTAYGTLGCGCNGFPADGPHALVVRGSRLAVFGSSFLGGDGEDGESQSGSCFGTICTDGGDGGAGLRLEEGSFLFATGAHFEGGLAGLSGDTPCETCEDGVPGDALDVGDGSEAYFVECTFDGPVSGSATLFPDAARFLHVPYLLPEEPPSGSATLTGDPGEITDLLHSARTTFLAALEARGVLVPGEPLHSLPLGVMPATGQEAFTPPALDLPDGTAARLTFQATLSAPGSGTRVLSTAQTALVVDAHPYSDCNGNGIPDAQDLLDGTSEDLDGSGIPDECEGLVLYVDDDAPWDPGPGDPGISDPDENGSSSHPFDSLQEAADAAEHGRTEIVVRAGTYTGAGNRDVVFLGKDVYLHSEGGPETCVFDLQSSGAALILESNESEDFRLEGFTFTGAPHPAAVRIAHASPRVRDCVFVQNAASGLSTDHGAPRIERCAFVRNGRGIRALGDVEVRDCLFLENSLVGAGAAISCTDGTPLVRHCTFVRNRGTYGGALLVDGNSPGTQLECHHDVFWGNTALAGANLYLASPTANVTVSYCDVEGGQASIHVGSGTLHWGAGNLDQDPRFVDGSGGDLHLTASSPCVDAGDPSFVADRGEVDLDGDQRVLGRRVDLGADEF